MPYAKDALLWAFTGTPIDSWPGKFDRFGESFRGVAKVFPGVGGHQLKPKRGTGISLGEGLKTGFGVPRVPGGGGRTPMP